MKAGRQTEIIQIILETITSREEGITKTLQFFGGVDL
jgi:hypothetical protein